MSWDSVRVFSRGVSFLYELSFSGWVVPVWVISVQVSARRSFSVRVEIRHEMRRYELARTANIITRTVQKGGGRSGFHWVGVTLNIFMHEMRRYELACTANIITRFSDTRRKEKKMCIWYAIKRTRLGRYHSPFPPFPFPLPSSKNEKRGPGPGSNLNQYYTYDIPTG